MVSSYETVRDLFTRALDLPEDERAAFLATACGDADVRAEVLSLLEQSDDGDGFLDEPPELGAPTQDAVVEDMHAASATREPGPGAGDRSLPAADDAPPPDGRIGDYRLIAQLGVGGMGVVWRAVQDFTQQEVALKVLRHPFIGGRGPSRLQREAELLARLSHPGIARVLQAGLTLDGRPWLAMELVRGQPLVDAANRRGLDVPGRMALLARVCDIVHAAHGQEVVHRDLKPDNVLVDEAGDPHVLDFGVARLLDDEGTAAPGTMLGQVIGTVAYMSPEQAVGASRTVDARSDVYALGVLLYELLSGRLPFPTRGRTISQAVRAILEDEPAPLAPPPGPHAHDVAVITGVAMARRREDRYASAAALADDLRRSLGSLPIAARPPSAARRAAAFVRRHKAFCVSSSVALVALVIGFGTATGQWRAALVAEHSVKVRGEALGRLADVGALLRLKDRFAALWPANAGNVAAMERWLAEARELCTRRDLHEAALARLAELTRDAAPGRERSSTRPKDQWFLRTEQNILGILDQLEQPDPYADFSIASMERRLQHARDVAASTLEDPGHSWAAASAAIAASPLYGGLVVPPQADLVPLGPDPDSGCWEFAVWGWTGRVPERDPVTRRLLLDGDTAMVLVLLPGGPVTLGAQQKEPTSRRFDPQARPNESPLRQIDLDPFFISKDEVTVGQWEALTGVIALDIHRQREIGTEETWRRHPAARVSWVGATEAFTPIGLALPTEAQWEYAARGGTETPRWWGPEESAFRDLANIADCARWEHQQHSLPEGAAAWRTVDDGWVFSWPSDWGRANAFGLRGLLGNVDELCRDVYLAKWRGELRAGDGLHQPGPDEPEEGLRSVRGGHFGEFTLPARSAFRGDTRREDSTHGVRPARALVGWSRDPR